MRVVRRRLVVPLHLPGVDVDGDDRAGEQVVHAGAARPRHVRRGRVAGAEDVEVRCGIVDARQPRVTAAVARGVEALPGVEPRIAQVHRYGVKAPLLRTGFRIERHQVTRRVEIVSGADDDVVADRHRRRRQEILLAERRRLLVPALFAGPRVERNEIVVGGDEVEIVAPHRDAAVADVRAPLRLPEVMPQLVAVMRIERPHVVGRRDVQDVVDRENRALDRGRTATGDRAAPFAADDGGGGAATGSAGDLRGERQRQLLHVRLVDLRERAVAAAGVIAGVARP